MRYSRELDKCVDIIEEQKSTENLSEVMPETEQQKIERLSMQCRDQGMKYSPELYCCF
jgi:hypothetical protein